MGRKETLLKLCEELTERVETLYKDCKSVLSDAYEIASYLDSEMEKELSCIIDDGFRALEKSRVKEISWEIRRVAEEIVQKEEGKENREEKAEGRKAILLKLCKELTEAIEYLYHEDDVGLKAYLGEVMVRYGSLLSNIGWAITWANEEVQDEVFKVIEDGFKRKHMLKCRLEEWLSWKVGEVVDSVFEDRREEKETQQTQTQKPTDELPF
jgi:hypothetical protein